MIIERIPFVATFQESRDELAARIDELKEQVFGSD